MKNGSLSKAFSVIIYAGLVFALFIWFVVYQNANASVLDGQAKLSFLDVGQADCAILNLPDSVQVVVDAGRDLSVVSKLAAKMPTFDKKIEYVVLSHPDSDHVGGFEAITQSYEIGTLIRSDAQSDSKTWQKVIDEIKNKKIQDNVVKSGDEIILDSNSKLNILWPDQNTQMSSNNGSIVFNLAIGESRAVFAGDAEVEAQNEVLRSNPALNIKAQIIKMSHHGSINGLNEDFLKIVKPEFAVVSVGKNSYGHPSQSVLSTLTNMNIQYFRTDQIGNVDFVSNGNTWVKK